MTESSFSNVELAIVLPLGVVASQLMRIEADLRLLNMKALDLGDAGSGGHAGRIEARLEGIVETLDSIKALMSDIGAGVQPTASRIRDSKSQLGRMDAKARSDRDD